MPNFGQKKITKVKRSDVRAFYNDLIERRGIKISTLDNVHTVLHQVFQLATDDDILRKNPTDLMLKEIKQAFGLQRKHLLRRLLLRSLQQRRLRSSVRLSSKLKASRLITRRSRKRLQSSGATSMLLLLRRRSLILMVSL